MDLDFFNPKEDDFHGVKGLLSSFLDEHEWNVSEFVDLIIAQVGFCTIIKLAEDETPIGLLTCLNLKRYKVTMSALITCLAQLEC